MERANGCANIYIDRQVEQPIIVLEVFKENILWFYTFHRQYKYI